MTLDDGDDLDHLISKYAKRKENEGVAMVIGYVMSKTMAMI